MLLTRGKFDAGQYFELYSSKGRFKSFPMGPCFLKGYHPEQVNAALVQIDPKTVRKCTWILIEAMLRSRCKCIVFHRINLDFIYFNCLTFLQSK